MTESRNKNNPTYNASNCGEFHRLAEAFRGTKSLSFVNNGEIFSARFASGYWFWFFPVAWFFVPAVNVVMFYIGQKLKVFYSVVRFNTVDMVNNFVFSKGSANVLGHYYNMLLNIPLIIGVWMRFVVNKNVSVFNSAPYPLSVIFTAIKRSVMTIFALFGAVMILPFFSPCSMSFKGSSAIVAS